MNEYPLTSFHFSVVFEIFPQLPVDTYFQEVTGLSAEAQYDINPFGGQNNFKSGLPTGTKFGSELVLKRGYTLISGISAWMIDAFENFNYRNTNLIVSLLNEEHLPVSSWYVVNALPVKWELSSFDAEDSKILIESMTLRYDYFKTLNLSSAPVLIAKALNLPNPVISITFP